MSDVCDDSFQKVGNTSTSKYFETVDSKETCMFTPLNDFQNSTSNTIHARRSMKKCKNRVKTKSSRKRKYADLKMTVSLNEKVKARDETPTGVNDNYELELSSQKSMSLLQECYEEMKQNNVVHGLTESCSNSCLMAFDCNSKTEMLENLHLEGNPLVVPNNGADYNYNYGTSSIGTMNLSDKSCQTDFSIFIKTSESALAKDAMHRMNLIGSVIKLKCILLSNAEISTQHFCEVLNQINAEFQQANSQFWDQTSSSNFFYSLPSSWSGNFKGVSKDTIKYFLRSSNVDGIFQDTISSLLSFLETALEKNCNDIAFSWKGSVYEMAAKMLNEAVNYEYKVRKMTTLFLTKIITSIFNCKTELQNLTLEAKATFIVRFCSSMHHSEVAIGHVIDQIKILKSVRLGVPLSLEEKLSHTRIIKNAYFLIRILQKILLTFISKSEEKETGAIYSHPDENLNILTMWRKHWRQSDVWTQRPNHRYELNVSHWSQDLDEILIHCVEHIPIVANAVELCAKLARDLVKINHSEILEYKI